jgi:hypothetical protein
MGAGSWALPPVGVGAGFGEVAGRGEFVPQVVEGIRFAVRDCGQCGACGGKQVVVAAPDDRGSCVEKVDLVTQRRNRGERLADDAAGCGPE